MSELRAAGLEQAEDGGGRVVIARVPGNSFSRLASDSELVVDKKKSLMCPVTSSSNDTRQSPHVAMSHCCCGDRITGPGSHVGLVLRGQGSQGP
mmetsp:Transcript_30588/g.49020  ORF Transcript_30588/g.49020 Transcript_30588/m.49020 type:complete len:94 (+) Transcript_30588:154-435(+)